MTWIPEKRSLKCEITVADVGILCLKNPCNISYNEINIYEESKTLVKDKRQSLNILATRYYLRN